MAGTSGAGAGAGAQEQEANLFLTRTMDVAEMMREKLTVPYSKEQIKDKSGKKLGKRKGKFKVA